MGREEKQDTRGERRGEAMGAGEGARECFGISGAWQPRLSWLVKKHRGWFMEEVMTICKA